MGVIVATFTKSRWHAVSWLIRWALPASRFKLALSSHVIIHDPYDDNRFYDAIWKDGVRDTVKPVAFNGTTIVKTVAYTVPDVDAAIKWVREQKGKPYDKLGAIGLGLDPHRDWSEDDSFHCYELLAATLKAGGRDVFENLNHISETALLALKP